MIEIIVNGEPRQVGEGITAAQLVEELELAGKRLAMEVNEELVPRSELPDYQLSAGDQVEIVVAIGGG
jgi:thiamine biosynthesis protein ThiS